MTKLNETLAKATKNELSHKIVSELSDYGIGDTRLCEYFGCSRPVLNLIKNGKYRHSGNLIRVIELMGRNTKDIRREYKYKQIETLCNEYINEFDEGVDDLLYNLCKQS